MTNPVHIAIVVSHPIQHFCPQYASFAKLKNIKLKVFFASTLGSKSYHDASFGQTIKWNNLRLEEFDHQFLNGGEVIQADAAIDAPELNAALDEFKPDVLIIYGYFQKLQRRAFEWARKAGVKIAYISDTELRQKRNPVKELLKHFWLKKFFSGIDYALTVGDSNETYYKKMGLKEHQLIRMHFPIDIELYNNSYPERQSLRRLIREKYNIGPRDYVAMVVGKLVSWKNQADIISAMKQLEEKGVQLHLFVVGSGEMLESIKEKALELKLGKVHFTGFVNAEELPGYYAAADVYIHPASVEPHSLAISEAIFMGLPAVISDRCGSYGPRDDVQEGRNGWVYPFGDIEALAEKISTLYSANGKMADFGNYSHEIAVQFQKSAHEGVIEQLLERLGNDSKP